MAHDHARERAEQLLALAQRRKRIRKERGMRLAALWLGIQQMRQFGAADPEAAETITKAGLAPAS